MLPFPACNPMGDFWSACSYFLSGARQVKSLEIHNELFAGCADSRPPALSS